ncbi:MAG: glycosyltransferase family 2 protein [Acidimicrobiales bacterium]
MSGPVAAVVVNFNSEVHLRGCLDSLRANGVARIVVVDNASTDASPTGDAPGGGLDGSEWVAAGANLGYGRAANLGAATVPGADLLVCNPDLVVSAGAVDALRARLDAEPAWGVVGPRLDNPDSSLYPSARAFPGLVDALGHGLLGSVAPANRFTRRYRMLDWDHDTPQPVDWVSGACFLARREAWDEVGGFDPAYFMYMEDVDLCWRLGQAGWRVGYEPAAVVAHHQGASTAQHPYRMLAAHHASMWRFAGRHTTGARRACLPLVGAALALRLGALSARHAWSSGRRARDLAGNPGPAGVAGPGRARRPLP